MRFTNTSGVSQNVPVTIFRYDGQRKFLRVYDSFEEMVRHVALSFEIPRPECIVLSTSTLPACSGNDVAVDKSAYPLLWPHIDEFSVFVLEGAVPNRPMEYQEISVMSRRSPTPPPIAIAPGSRASRRFSAATVPSTRMPTEARQPRNYPTATPTSDASRRDVEEVANMTLHPAGDDPLFDFDEADYHERDHEEGIDEERAPTPSPPTPSPPPRRSKPAALPTAPEPEGLRIKKEKVRENTKDPATPTTPSESSRSIVGNTKNDNPKRHPTAQDDSRFELTIIGPTPSMKAQFKLRGKNSVKKVLTAACKNFEIDLERARLVQIIENEEDGEIYTDEIPCSPDDTMAMCGINAQSKLVIKLDSLSEEEDYERARLNY